MFVADLREDGASDVRSRSWFGQVLRFPLARQDAPAPVPRPPGKRLAAYGFSAAVALYAMLYGLATLVAKPLSEPSATTVAYPIELAATGTRSVTVLAHGREVGWHVLRVPSASSGNPARVIPAQLADAELKVISLSGSTLSLRTIGPFGPVVSLKTQGRIMTVYRTPERAGVRSGW